MRTPVFRLPHRLSQRALMGLCLVVYLGLAVWTQRDYGLTWDCWEMYTGDRYWEFFTTLDPGYLDFTRPMPTPLYKVPGHPDFFAITMAGEGNMAKLFPHHIWPVGVTAATACCQLFFRLLGWRDPLDARNLAAIGFGLAVLWAMYAFGRRQLGPVAAGAAVVCLMIHPRWWWHLHVNYKDVPSTLFFMLTLVCFYRGVVLGRWRWLTLSALCWGVGLATKANLFFVPLILLPWYAWWAWTHHLRPRRWPGRGVIVSLITYPFVGVAAFLLCWPYMLLDFPAHLHDYFGYLTQRGYEGNDSWSALPVEKLLTTTPLVVMLLAALGLVVIARRTVRKRRLHPFHAILLGWIVVTVGRVSIPGAVDFDGIRHWLEVLPALALLAGIGVQGGWAALRRRRLGQPWRRVSAAWLATGLLLAPTVAWCVRNHPNEVVFYNSLCGGVPGAARKDLGEVTDYWASSYRVGMRWLNEHAAPDSMVIIGVADHVMAYTHELWLRPDLQPRSAMAYRPDQLVREILDYPSEVYLFYVTREPYYGDFVKELDRRMEPVKEWSVDGVPVLKIIRIRPAPQEKEPPANATD